MMQNRDHADLQSQLQIWLQAEFTRRCRANARYSIRAFAKNLQMDSSTLSQIMNGKRRVSAQLAAKLRQDIGQTKPRAGASSVGAKILYEQVQVDAFYVIADWYHFALLDLVQVKNFRNEAPWIARRLGISTAEAKVATDRLLRLGLLIEKNKRLLKSKQNLTNYTEGVTSDAHKEYQRQVIGKALIAVDQCPQGKKDITAITIVTSAKRIAEAKEKIKLFRRELCSFLENGQGDSVYHLAVQMYPVTNLED